MFDFLVFLVTFYVNLIITLLPYVLFVLVFWTIILKVLAPERLDWIMYDLGIRKTQPRTPTHRS